MSQVNLRVDLQFEKDLFAVMAALRIASKSQAIRFAVREMADAIGRGSGREAGAKRAASA
jgi:hypothetical protein